MQPSVKFLSSIHPSVQPCPKNYSFMCGRHLLFFFMGLRNRVKKKHKDIIKKKSKITHKRNKDTHKCHRRNAEQKTRFGVSELVLPASSVLLKPISNPTLP